jgi:WD40 repeat protein
MSTQPFIFISYARDDGESFATDLRQKLADEFSEDALWQDRVKMRGSLNWWHQITEALDNVRFMVLVATPAAMASKTVQKEWRYARQQGVWVYPVKVPASPVDFGAMPRWMSDGHFYDLDKEWQTFLNDLQKTDRPPNVPFMPPDMPEHFVERPDHFNALVEQLLDEERDNPVAITTSLTGAGGFGKTTLAAAICHDEDVQTAFDDGVLWVTLGEKPDLVAAIAKLYDALTDELPDFVDVEQGARRLAEKLDERDCLIVIDDVWNPAHVRPFLRGGERCARLITTRFAHIAVEANAKQNTVDEMTGDQAVEMLVSRIDNPPDERETLKALAQRLGEWPLMLEIANGILRERLLMGNSFERALEWVERTLDKRGVNGIRRDDEVQRKRSAYDVLAASIELLEENEAQRLFELAIFREDAAIPITSVIRLWNLDDFDSEDLLMKFARFSLIKFEPENGISRLHDVVRQVLESRLTENTSLPIAHNKLITAYGDLTNLPDTYAWQNIAHHLACVMDMVKLGDLLLDFKFLQNKLNNTNPNALISDCDLFFSSPLRKGDPNDMRAIYLVQSALGMSSHILITDATQLASHLVGRLMSHTNNTSVSKLLSTINLSTPWIRPLSLSLEQAGGPLVRTFSGHEDGVNAVALTSDNKYIVSASKDHALRIWDLDTGEAIRTLRGHDGSVNSIALTSDDQYIVSCSSDATVRIWDFDTGEIIRILQGHEGSVNSIALTSDDQYIVSASSDSTIRIWNLRSGEIIRILDDHHGSVDSIALTSDDRYIVSASKVIAVWDLVGGNLSKILGNVQLNIGTLETMYTPINIDLIAVPNSQQVISCHGQMMFHTGELEDFYKSAIYVWDAVTGELINSLESGSLYLCIACDSDGKYISVGTGAAYLGFEFAIQKFQLSDLSYQTTYEHAHSSNVAALAYTYDNLIISGSLDNKIKLWDLSLSSHEFPTVQTYGGYGASGIAEVHIDPDGVFAVSAVIDNQERAVFQAWDVHDAKIIYEWRTFWKGGIGGLIISEDGNHAVSISRRHSDLAVIDLYGRKTILKTKTKHGKSKLDSAFVLPSQDYLILIVVERGTQDTMLELWDMVNGKLLISSLEDRFTDIDFGEKYNLQVSWELGHYEIRNLTNGESTIIKTEMEKRQNPQFKLIGNKNDTVSVYDIRQDKIISSFTADFKIESYDISENNTLVVGDGTGHVFFLKLENY